MKTLLLRNLRGLPAWPWLLAIAGAIACASCLAQQRTAQGSDISQPLTTGQLAST